MDFISTPHHAKHQQQFQKYGERKKEKEKARTECKRKERNNEEN